MSIAKEDLIKLIEELPESKVDEVKRFVDSLINSTAEEEDYEVDEEDEDYETEIKDCPNCGGTGETGDYECQLCNGEGTIVIKNFPPE